MSGSSVDLTSFTRLMASLRADGGRFAVDVPEDWRQGRTTYGGLAAALCLEGALRAMPDLAPLRSAQIVFIGPADGMLAVEASVLRAGRSVTFVEADLSADKGLAARAIFAFGAARESMFDRAFLPAPSIKPPEDCEPYIPEGMGPPFAAHFETRLAAGGRPGTGSSGSDLFLWVRHRDRAATSLSALLALADMPPPAVMPMFPRFAPISSMTWGVNFLATDSSTEDGWFLLATKAENAADGYSSQDMFVWARDGCPLVASRQSVAIFI
ncbi:acyl-CoA thioesterase [Amphiplicatus metriothermophilus]|uniref:Acyl-CoA thioesterase n=1 Tax=Amphiplicatus metriothermophilus TaxID=1519374 RepID=A0A239PWX2_9PROT|nr:thioesterase family protein [Amphiplicatus metriothermophilus]MBB5518947.1 acyl-CoA thioesterase [Amphiplicatus metriothermophilus]SNT74523.1 Acyl-CoA thioesterase [Amphiplicatus metriothermophilus]